ncbi:MAG: L,D-transpeptidase family protein [Gammaproteobacteria bacterium]|nr:L,D-transpeptidase family protein [Gammaproteobacteria bacterium]
MNRMLITHTDIRGCPHKLSYVLALYFAVQCTSLHAQTYMLPPDGDEIVGTLQMTFAQAKDTLLDIARDYNQGYNAIRQANPGVDTWLPGEGKEVVLPSYYILPKAPREGIVLNMPEMRLYYYPKSKRGEPPVVITYPISIGRQDWSTPFLFTRVREKVVNPAWYPPESIREEHAADGDLLPKVVPPGPDNPMGAYALRLGIPGYLIHGTNKPYGLGMRVTHGCIRLYPEDIEQLFHQVDVGTPVRIVNQPYKVGWRGGELYLEVHPYLDEDERVYKNNMTPIVQAVVDATQEKSQEVDWDKVRLVWSESRGIPIPIGLRRSADTQIVEKRGEQQSMPLAPLIGVKGPVSSLQLRLDTKIGGNP